MGEVVHLFPSYDVAESLRNIANGFDAGEYEGNCTVILGLDVFHIGTTFDDRAAVEAVWNMQYGISKLMKATVDYAEGEIE